MNDRLRIGTRGSPLALWQTHHVGERLSAAHPGLEIEYITIHTQGDIDLESPLELIGGKGLFTSALEEALAAGRIDLAVHSLKDLPTTLPDAMALGAVLEREEPWDALVAKEATSLGELPKDAIVATGSPRRRSQLLHCRPDLQIVNVRGNVGTRLRKLDESDWEAMILAAAGLVRLGLADRIAHRLTADEVLPAIGQGAMAVETREDDAGTRRLLEELDHSPTRAATTAERALLEGLGGGCQMPVGGLARTVDGTLRLDGVVASIDGRTLLRDSVEGPPADARELGLRLAEALLSAGAREILDALKEEDRA